MMGATANGWSGIALAYAAVQAPMFAGLMRSRARLTHYLASPVVAAPLMGIAAAATAASGWLLSHAGVETHGLIQLGIGTGLSTLMGYAGGEAIARDAAADKSHRRGTLVRDVVGSARSNSLRPDRNAGITLAGISIPE